MDIQELTFQFLCPAVFASALRFRQIDMCAVRKCFQAFLEGIVLIFHEKTDDVASGAAAETVIDLFPRTYGKGRGLFPVKRAKAEIIGPFFRKADILPYDIDDIVGLPNLFNCGFIITHEGTLS